MTSLAEGFPGFWRRPAWGALTAGLFLGYLIALAPHLVHHAFDEDHGRPACPLFAQIQQTPELQAAPPTLAPPIPIGVVGGILPRIPSASPTLIVFGSRAPPPAPSA